MKDQLKLLEELQTHDAALQELSGMLKTIPEKLRAMKSDLGRVERLLESERVQLEETERWRAQQEDTLRNEEQLSLKAKTKLQAVKNTKEFMATQRELETTRKMAQEREEEVLKILAVVEDSKKNIAAHEADLEIIRQTVAKEEREAAVKLAQVEQKVSEAKAARDELAKRVKADVMRRYSTIRLRRGLAVVPVKNGTCQGCNMNIPPQLYNILQRGVSLESCPNCNRIIYWDKFVESSSQPDPQGDEASSSGKKS